MASEIKVDTISEKTSAGGVTIDGLLIKDGNISGDVSLIGTTPTFTIGDAGAEDAALVFDGNAKDFYVALDDSSDKLVIGEGSTVGTNSILTITDDTVTIGDAAAVDTAIVFDGNAQDFYIALDDSADDLVIGLGSTVGTTPAISINEDRDVTISDGAIDFDVASHDGTNGLKLGGTLVTTTAAEMNLLDGGTSVGSSITVADADGFVVNDGGTMKTIPATDITTYAGFTATTITGTTALAETPAKTDEMIISDAGTLKRLDMTHIYNRPAFHVYLSGDLEIAQATNTKVTWDAERFDSDGNFASNKFTVPSDGAGVYVFNYSGKMGGMEADEYVQLFLFKNGSELNSQTTRTQSIAGEGTVELQVFGSYVVTLAATDYIEVYCLHNEGAANNLMAETAYFAGYRLIGA